MTFLKACTLNNTHHITRCDDLWAHDSNHLYSTLLESQLRCRDMGDGNFMGVCVCMCVFVWKWVVYSVCVSVCAGRGGDIYSGRCVVMGEGRAAPSHSLLMFWLASDVFLTRGKNLAKADNRHTHHHTPSQLGLLLNTELRWELCDELSLPWTWNTRFLLLSSPQGTCSLSRL